MSKTVFFPSRLEPSSRELDHEVWENVVNERGDPRLGEARNYFLPLTRDRIPTLVEVFQYWRDYHEYLLLKGENRETGEKLRLAVKCSKRGNDVYAKRLDMRLNFLDRLENVRFFDKVDFDKVAYARANLFWVTLSWDPKLCTLDEAWRSSYRELHKFKANLEHHYGKVEWLVFIQPFPNQNGEAFGYPHFHIVLWFKEAEFNVFPHLEKDKSGALVLRYRVKEKREIEVAGRWHSFIDVQALSSLRGAVSYVKKYAKSVCYGENSKAVLNGAVAWLYRKKSYSLTRGFQAALHDLISAMRVRKTVFQSKMVLKEFKYSFHTGITYEGKNEACEKEQKQSQNRLCSFKETRKSHEIQKETLVFEGGLVSFGGVLIVVPFIEIEKAYSIWEWEFLGIRSAAEVGDPGGGAWVLEFGADQFDCLVRGR